MAKKKSTDSVNDPRHFFTNEDILKVTNPSGDYGIVGYELNGAIKTTDITDQFTRDDVLGKFGSSIPSPLARLYLFQTALKEVNAYQRANSHLGHLGFENATGEIEPNFYHYIVSELLDMLEFIFKYGDDEDFDVVEWRETQESSYLEKSKNKGHHNLRSALDSAFNDPVFKDKRIYLFRWKGYVLGGTSPISLVYTSANLKNIIKKNDFHFVGNNANVLFEGEATPLHKRDPKFVSYLYQFSSKHKVDTITVDGNTIQLLGEFINYVVDSKTYYGSTLWSKVIDDDFKGTKLLKGKEGASITICGDSVLRVLDSTIVVNHHTCDYILDPTVEFFKHNNSAAETPMILTKNGEPHFKYVDRIWNPDTDEIPAVLDSNIYNRYLPGFGKQKYPFLTIDDFFEKKVIEVSYGINKNKFFTGCQQKISFLLPLKQLFFEYFTLDDLLSKDMLKVEYDEEREKLTVTLELPLKNGKSISLEKIYNTEENKVDCYDSSKTFDFAVFPFYRLEPDTKDNVYHIMLGSTIATDMKFYELTHKGIDSIVAESKQRLRGKDGSISSYHIKVDGPFSFAEIEVAGTKALVIPLFKKIESDPALASNYYKFSIDFGTTNTHICYAKVGSKDAAIGGEHVETFCYDDQDSQMVEFHDENGSVEFGHFTTVKNREFVPAKLGNDNNPLKFPMRTTTCEVIGQPTKHELFYTANIGFNYSQDISQSNIYKTNIKWDRDSLAEDRMEVYFKQMLWMMKNKSLLNEGSNKFDLSVTYPLSMSNRTKKKFDEAWRRAIEEVKCDVTIKQLTESVAPYYSDLASISFEKPYLNMDIGGGTSDILYVNPYSNEASQFSAFFAANDLWNDGIDPGARANKANGFIRFYEAKMGASIGAMMTTFNAVKNNSSSSEDIIGYLFSNENLRFSQTVENSPEMSQLLVVHFSALIFYTGYALYMRELDAPGSISFSGMGSKYIKMISPSSEDIAKLVNAIFKYVGEKYNYQTLKDANVKISFAGNPKVSTAKGALIANNYSRPIVPDIDTFYGYVGEEPNNELRIRDITENMKDKVMSRFEEFLGMFDSIDVKDALSDMENKITIVDKLKQNGPSSLLRMKNMLCENADDNDRLKEPMFFWPLKDSLYIIGKDLAQNLNN